MNLNLNPHDALTDLRERTRAYTTRQGPRIEEGRALEAAIGQAELAASNLSHAHLTEADRQQTARALTFEIEFARGTLQQQATQWR